MKQIKYLLPLLLLLLLTSAASYGAMQDIILDDGSVVSNEGLISGETVVIIPDKETFENAVRNGSYTGARIINSYPPLSMLRLEYPIREAVADGKFRRACVDDAADISPNYIRRAHIVPNDPKYVKQTYLGPIDAEDGWDLFYGDAGVTIAIIDTGIEIDHPDLQVNIVGGKNLIPGENPADLSDPHGHGTAVTGIVAASTDNGVGIAGICWRVRVLIVKVLGGEELTTTLFEEAAAIDYAVSAGARVINMSFGGPGTSSVEKAAIQNAWDAGVVLVASAGNNNEYGDKDFAPSGLNFPAAFEQVIGVGALNEQLAKADFSNYGDEQCEFVAVGEGVYTTLPGNLGDIINPIIKGRNYGWANGTSFAAPQVTALAALLRMKEPGLSVSGIRKRIQENALPMGGPDNDGDGVDDYLGYGIIQCRDTLADSPVGRNIALKAGAFASPLFPEKLNVYVRTLKNIDPGSLSVSANPVSAPVVQFEMIPLEHGGYLGTISWGKSFGPVEIEISASDSGIVYPDLIITYKP